MWNLSFHLCLCFTAENFTVNCRFDPLGTSIDIIFRKLHGTSADIGEDDDEAVSNQSQDDDDQRSVKSLDLEANQSDGETNGRNKKEFLKDLERSLRTGRPIHVDENNVESNSYPDPSNYFYRWIGKYIR